MSSMIGGVDLETTPCWYISIAIGQYVKKWIIFMYLKTYETWAEKKQRPNFLLDYIIQISNNYVE